MSTGSWLLTRVGGLESEGGVEGERFSLLVFSPHQRQPVEINVRPQRPKVSGACERFEVRRCQRHIALEVEAVKWIWR